MRKPLSLYIHIPFCSSKCTYCSFISKVGTSAEKSQYVSNLLEEIKMRAKQFNPRYEISTIYIGGGTPSCLPDGSISRILNEIYSKMTVRNRAEITLEVNPESVTFNKVLEYSRAGINRISIGLQCAQTSLLSLMGRTHTFDDFENAVNKFRSVGINNISADIILGYPNQKQSDVKETISKLIALNIPHISAYMLNVEEGTQLYDQLKSQNLKLPTEKTTILMYQNVVQQLNKFGYVRYEVSNFAKIGFKSNHNETYWKRREYLGLGPSSHSFVDNIRFANYDSISEYNKKIESHNFPVESVDHITKEDAKEEFIMLSLRLQEGLDLNEYEKQFGENFAAAKKQKIADLMELKLLKIENDHIKATNAGFLVLNRIILELAN